MNWKQACLSAALLAGAMIAFPDRAPAQPAPGQETGQACLQASERPCGSWTVADRMPASRYPSATSGGSQLGIYRGGWHEDLVRDFEQWLGREAAFAIIFTGDNGWSDWGGSLAWVIGQWPRGRKLLYSVPLIPKGASLEQAASGAYNDHYMAAARVIASREPNAMIRVGWEFNGDWYPWSAARDPKAYRGAFRQFVRAFRSVSPDFRFTWCTNLGTMSVNPELAYPGDDVVDVIAMDVYENSAFDKGDGPANWQDFLSRSHGLTWHRDFAARHGKPMAYPEWGTDRDDGYFIHRMADWFRQNNVAYQAYWNANSGIDADLSEKPNAQAAYKQEFGR